MEIKEAKKKFNNYYECPHGCGAVYHTEALSHRNFECKDCRQTFLVPHSIKINAPKPFHAGKKPEYKPRG